MTGLRRSVESALSTLGSGILPRADAPGRPGWLLEEKADGSLLLRWQRPPDHDDVDSRVEWLCLCWALLRVAGLDGKIGLDGAGPYARLVAPALASPEVDHAYGHTPVDSRLALVLVGE